MKLVWEVSWFRKYLRQEASLNVTACLNCLYDHSLIQLLCLFATPPCTCTMIVCVLVDTVQENKLEHIQSRDIV